MNRKLILHIGHAKTGTTTLQRTLVASQSVLSAQGIMHPSTAPHKHNHRMLIPHLLEPKKQSGLNPETREAKDLWQSVVQQIETEAPHTIVLSSEQLFRPWKPKQMNAMIAKLRRVSSNITVVAYIREPADLMLSSLQQNLKSKGMGTSGLVLPNPRSTLEAYQKAGFDALKVRAFDRNVLAGGNLVEDFFSSFLPTVKLSDLVLSEDNNTSMSAEAMALLQDIHIGKRRFHIGKPRREVRRVDEQLAGFSRPQLLPEIRDAIHTSYVHYDWLRDKYNLTFPGIDVPDMNTDAARSILAGVKTVEDACKVDTVRKSRLWQSLSRPHAMLRRLFRPA